MFNALLPEVCSAIFWGLDIFKSKDSNTYKIASIEVVVTSCTNYILDCCEDGVKQTKDI